MIFLILLVSLILRLITLNQSLWLDESINVLAGKSLSFWQFVSSYPIGDFHPPLYFGILWIWERLFGYSEISVRFPSVILGVASVYLTYLLGKELFSKKVGLVSAWLTALGPILVFYSQEARMYSLSVFAAVLSFYFFTKLLKDKKFLLPFALSVLLVLYSEYLTYLILPAEFLSALVFNKKKWREVLLGMVIGALPFIPWLLVFPKQLSSGIQTSHNVPGWAKVVGQSSFKELALVFVKGIIGRVSFANKTTYGLVVLIVGFFYGLTVWKLWKKFNDQIKMLTIWIVAPLLVAFLVSFAIPILSYFRMIYVLPILYVLVARGLEEMSGKYYKITLGVLVSVSLISLVAYYLNPNFQREDWKDLSKFLNNQASSQNLVVFENNNLPAPYQYYDSGRVQSVGGLSKFPASSTADVINLAKQTQGKDKIFLVDYLVEISDPKRSIDRELTQIGFKVNKVDNFPGVGLVYEYER